MKNILHSTAVVFLSIGCITIIQSCEENLFTSNQPQLHYQPNNFHYKFNAEFGVDGYRM